MLRVRPNFSIIKTDEKYSYILADISVSNANELDTELIIAGKNFKFVEGCIAWDISTGDFYGLDGNGNWIKQGV